MRMPTGMRTVNERAKMTGLMTGPRHPAVRKMAKSMVDGEMEGGGTEARQGPPNFRDAMQIEGGESPLEGPGTDSCATCQDFMAEGGMEGEGGMEEQTGRCHRFGVPTSSGKVCDAYTAKAGEDEEYGELPGEVAAA